MELLLIQQGVTSLKIILLICTYYIKRGDYLYKDILCGIYCIENKTTQKKYIGQSRNINSRWCHHKAELNNDIHDNDYLQKAWNKYGEDDFKFYILEECDISMLDDKERYYIELYDTLDRSKGYNLKTGGQDTNCKLKETNKKLSESIKQSYNNSNLRERRKQDALKQWANPNIKKKIMGSNNGMYGKHHTEEARKNMSEKHKGIAPKHKNLTPVLCVELNKIFDNVTEAGKALGFNGTSILQVCYGNRKTTHGYHWEFVKEEE